MIVDIKKKTTNTKQQTTTNKQHTPNNKQHTTTNTQQTANNKQHTLHNKQEPTHTTHTKQHTTHNDQHTTNNNQQPTHKHFIPMTWQSHATEKQRDASGRRRSGRCICCIDAALLVDERLRASCSSPACSSRTSTENAGCNPTVPRIALHAERGAIVATAREVPVATCDRWLSACQQAIVCQPQPSSCLSRI